MRRFLFLLVYISILTACRTAEKNDANHQPRPTKPLPPAETKVVKGDFIYRLFTEKDVYDIFGDTAIFAELTYIGDQASIDISHAASPFYFPLEERTRGISIDYPMNEPLIVTTLKKDEPLRARYSFAGGNSENDDEKIIEFIQTLINEGFPKGEYIIHGSAEFNIELGTIDVEPFKLEADIGFIVTEGVNE